MLTDTFKHLLKFTSPETVICHILWANLEGERPKHIFLFLAWNLGISFLKCFDSDLYEPLESKEFKITTFKTF